jgi:tRNA(Arg) A34 adenosine deaminase TadA
MNTCKSLLDCNKEVLSTFTKHGVVIAINYAKNQFNKWNNTKHEVYVPKM